LLHPRARKRNPDGPEGPDGDGNPLGPFGLGKDNWPQMGDVEFDRGHFHDNRVMQKANAGKSS